MGQGRIERARLVHCRFNPSNIEVPKSPKKIKRSWVWTSPSTGVIKVSVDGSFLKNSSRKGIRVVLRNYVGELVLQFGKQVIQLSMQSC